MNTYTVEHNGIKLEQIPLDRLTVQLQMQGLIVLLPHEHQHLLKQCNVSGAFEPDQIIWPDIEKTKNLYRREYNPDCTGRDEDVIEWTLNNVQFLRK